MLRLKDSEVIMLGYDMGERPLDKDLVGTSKINTQNQGLGGQGDRERARTDSNRSINVIIRSLSK